MQSEYENVRQIVEAILELLAAHRRNCALAQVGIIPQSKDRLAILDATHNPVLQGFRGAIDTILSAVFLVAVGTTGWFEDNLPNHAAAARAIDEGNAKKARAAMEQVLGCTQLKLSKRSAARSRKPAAKAKRKRNAP